MSIPQLNSKTADDKPTDPSRDFPAYLTLESVFGASLLLFLLAHRLSGRHLPNHVSPSDMLLMGIATYKMSRILTRSKITMPLRAPFAAYEQGAGYGEVEEAPRGHGLRRVIGEALTCPYCIGVWIAAFVNILRVISPGMMRFITALFSTAAVADLLQKGDAALKEE